MAFVDIAYAHYYSILDDCILTGGWVRRHVLFQDLMGTGVVNRVPPLVVETSFLWTASDPNCLNGYFHFPFFDSLAEGLLKAEDRGAIAAFSPTGLSLNRPAHRYHKALLEALLHRGHRRLGDALLDAQKSYAESELFRSFSRSIISLEIPRSG